MPNLPFERGAERRPSIPKLGPMTKQGTYTVAGIALGIVAFVGFEALFEHLANLKGREWLEHIFPFGIAANPMWLTVVSFGALAISVLLLRQAKRA